MNSYGRGVGTIPDQCPPNTEKDGALCYPLCDAGYKGVSFVCWQICPSGYRDDGAYCAKPDIFKACPSGWEDIGVSCHKKSYTRSAGEVMICSDTQDSDVGLCYTKCKANYKGIGPVCWGTCPKPPTIDD